jgi:hypothetical protein
MNFGMCIAEFIYNIVCLMRGPLPFSKRVLHRVQSCARVSNSHIFFTLTSSSGCLHCAIFFLSHLSFNSLFYQAVPTQVMTNPVSLPSFYYISMFLSSLNLFNTFLYPTRSGKLIYSFLLQHHILKRSGNI